MFKFIQIQCLNHQKYYYIKKNALPYKQTDGNSVKVLFHIPYKFLRPGENNCLILYLPQKHISAVREDGTLKSKRRWFCHYAIVIVNTRATLVLNNLLYQDYLYYLTPVYGLLIK